MLRDAPPPNAEPANTAAIEQDIAKQQQHVRNIASGITKTCLCDNAEACQSLTAAFSFLNDARTKFVLVPSNHELREEYLKPLSVSKTSSSDYIAAHHFDPTIVLHQHNVLSESGEKNRTMVLPKTISEKEAMQLGVDLQGWHDVLDDQGKKQFRVVPNYPLEKTRADLTVAFASKSKSNKQCLCGNSGNRCKALTATFRMLHDPRRGFVRIPRYHHKKGFNHVRNAYLRHLLPHHVITKETPTKYVAAHHFDPSIVLAHEECIGRPDEKLRAVPRILTKEQVMQMGVNVDTCETMEDAKLGRVYIVAPCFSIEQAEANVTLLLNQIYNEVTEGDADGDILKEDIYQALTPGDSNKVNSELASAAQNGSLTTNTCSPDEELRGDVPLSPHDESKSILGHGNLAKSLVVGSAKANGSMEEEDFPPTYHEHIASIKALYHETTSDDCSWSVEPITRIMRSESPFNDKRPEPSRVDAVCIDKCDDRNIIDESPPVASTLTEQVVPKEPEAVTQLDVSVPVHVGGMVETKEPLDDHSSQEKADQTAMEEQHSEEQPVVISSPALEQETKSPDQNASTVPRAIEFSEQTPPAKLTNANKDSSPHLKVNFGNVSIREYPIIPGDNPGGIKGPPLTIDWKPQREVNLMLDSYEASRPQRRTQTEFDMPPNVRLQLLRNTGHSLVEIQKYQKKANIVRNRRRSTNGLSHFFVFSETRERLTRGLSNLTFRKAQKQKEREFLHRSLQMDQRYAKERSGLTEIPSLEDEHAPS